MTSPHISFWDAPFHTPRSTTFFLFPFFLFFFLLFFLFSADCSLLLPTGTSVPPLACKREWGISGGSPFFSNPRPLRPLPGSPFLFSFCSPLIPPLLSQVHRDPTRLQTRVGSPYSRICARRALSHLWFVFNGFFLFIFS